MYLISFVFFCSGVVIWGIFILNYLNSIDTNLVYFIFNWPHFTNEHLFNLNSIFLYFFGCCLWLVVIFYLQSIRAIRFSSIIKSISLFFLFWLNLIVFTWLAGVFSYKYLWGTVHFFFSIWLCIGLISSLAIVFGLLSSQINNKINLRFLTSSFKSQKKQRKSFRKLLGKYQASFLIGIQFIVGVYLSISDGRIPTKINYDFDSLTPFMIIIFTMIAMDILFLFNFILSIKANDHVHNQIEELMFNLVRFELVLKTARSLTTKETKFSSQKSFDKIISMLNKGIDYFQNIHNEENRNNFLGDLKILTKDSEQRLIEMKKILNPLEVENQILKLEQELKVANKLQKKDIPKSIQTINNVILSFSKIKEDIEKSTELKDIGDKLESKIEYAQYLRSQIQEKMDEFIGLKEIPAILNERDRDSILSIIREYDFIGGQIRFKVAVINNTSFTFTGVRLAFDLPTALKWIIHEPNYERKGDSILISKLGAHEKQAVSLYLEPINCMESSVNVTVSFFDAKEKPHAVPMKPKMIAISCPIFFTENEANLARVKSLRRSLANHDKKVFPIVNPQKGNTIFTSILSVLGTFDIKLVSKEFDEDNNFGEAWFYAMTKVKKNRLIPYVLLDGENKVLEFEVAGDDAEQITSFLAEVSDRVRRKLIHDKVINPDDKFFDMRITVMSNFCPYCYTLISQELVNSFLHGKSIQCQNCLANINLDER